MSQHERLVAEINAQIDELGAEGRTVDPTWVAHAVCQKHEAGLTEDEEAQFWRYLGYAEVRRMTTKVINRLFGDNAERGEGKQIKLLGFERDHLQDYYVVERDGKEVGVPILGPNQITDAEIDAKTARLRKIGEATFAHADEMQRFKVWRRGQADQDKAG